MEGKKQRQHATFVANKTGNLLRAFVRVKAE